ncbi:cytochrome c [Roseibacterium sp. SDUM158016]|uniref:c-type cytochrome n=1 Tax=Roseicyclus sediminis TaxID=2980997 RepID=UPI0021CE8C67|nr:cytochrome c [Roseibacterium sp. SDUM158016]MCU4654206.1 cytochrome c [Roseibacterium sp. SDUM158016]
MRNWNTAAKLLAAFALVSSPSFADSVGEQEYMVACAGCHGESGLGDGPLAGLLNIETPNLRGLSMANGGTFPVGAVLATVDGRDGVRAHGSAMPVWGDRFQASASSERGETAEMVARGRILSLVYYLESIQQ